MDGDSIESLTAAAAGGDKDALERLLERHLPELHAYVERRAGAMLRAHESQSDLVQSVCREILQHSEKFQHPGEGAFRRWLFTTALRKLSHRRDFIIADRRDMRRREGAQQIGSTDGALEEQFVTDRTPSHEVALQEEMSRIERALASLTDEYRLVIQLSRVEGLSRTEVAERMQRSEGSVRMLLHRALAALAIELKEPAPNDRD
ncbi:MAG: sigma-70 family RNA polymerase sigma factor [Planctomycetota bacterium]